MSQAESTKQRDALATLRIDRSGESRRRWRMRSLVKSLLFLVVLLVLGGIGVGLAARNGWLQTVGYLTSKPEVTVAFVEVQTGQAAEAVVVATGYLESRRQAAIGAKAPGRIQEVSFEEGTHVQKGQVLAVLEHADFDASLSAAQALLRQSQAQLAEQDAQAEQDERDYRRADDLIKRKVISTERYEQAQAKLDMSRARRDMLQASVALAEARVREAQQQRENMFIRAPFDGTVISKDAEVGESILPGGMGEASGRGSVAVIADLEDLEVDTDVKEDYISRVRAGQTAEVAVDAVPDRRYTGRVRTIIPMGDRCCATIKVKVKILDVDEQLFPEMSSTVYFLPESEAIPEEALVPAQKKILCPSDAVQHLPDGQYVWLVDSEDRVSRTAVRTRPSREGQTEIESGLEGGERVVLRPPSDLQDGQQVKVVQ